MINPDSTQDLRNAFLFIFDSFATDPTEFAESTDSGSHVNTKYARELFGILTNVAHLVAVAEDGDGNDCWQAVETYDNKTREEAEATIDAWLASQNLNTIKESTTMTATKPTTGNCYCGCGAPLTGKSFYKPGHDARHAGIIGRRVAEDGDTAHYNALPSNALVEKARNITQNAIEKANKKQAAAEAREAKKAAKADASVDVGDDGTAKTEHGIVKVGKEEYIAVRYTATGEVEYFKGDETKKASKTAAKTFTVE